MNEQIAVWLCVAITLIIFAIDCAIVRQQKRTILEKLEWEEQ